MQPPRIVALRGGRRGVQRRRSSSRPPYALLRARRGRFPGFLAAVLNHKQGLMTSLKRRQAFEAALDMEPIMDAAAGHYLFYRLDPGLWPPELVFLNSTAGAALYNQKDKAKARRLLKEAGYTGQPVRWLTTNEAAHHYKSALVAKQQLEGASSNGQVPETLDNRGADALDSERFSGMVR